MLTASPSRRWLLPVLVLAIPVIVLCTIPILLVLASFVGVVRPDLNLLFVAIPAAGVAVLLARVVWRLVGDLLLKRPVLTIDDTGLFDARVADAPIPWTDITAATSLRGAGRGGVVLELRTPLQTRLDPTRPGTLLFEQPDPGIAHVALDRMTVSAAQLETAILQRAEAAGATVGTATTHPRMQRTRLHWF